MPGFPAANPLSMPLNPFDPRVNMKGWSWRTASSSQTVAKTVGRSVAGPVVVD